jgi:hypothetical protein
LGLSLLDDIYATFLTGLIRFCVSDDLAGVELVDLVDQLVGD